MKQNESSGHLPSLRMTTEKYGPHEDNMKFSFGSVPAFGKR
jgi:hypothetical protein